MKKRWKNKLSVLDASCQQILFSYFYTLHLIYLPTTATRSWAKPLLLQSAAQDSLPNRAEKQVYFRYVKSQQRSNSAHVLKETNGLVMSRCSIHSAVSGGHWYQAASRGMSTWAGLLDFITRQHSLCARDGSSSSSGMKQVRGRHPTKHVTA